MKAGYEFVDVNYSLETYRMFPAKYKWTVNPLADCGHFVGLV